MSCAGLSSQFAICAGFVAAVAVAACSSRPAAKQPAAADDRVPIVAAERGPQGTRIVALDESGDRQFDLLEESDGTARDTHPAISPDGAWLVFASSRGRPLDETSLWIAPLAARAVPRRLTDGVGIESHPVWSHDGTSVVFASTREGGDFDLYRMRVESGQAMGAPDALTSGAGHEVTPAVGRDGSIVYASVSPKGEAQIESHLEARAPDGAITRVTEGPADTTPALSPDERTLVFARPIVHAAGPDAELWSMPREGGATTATPLIELPLTDESGPVWSPDGRYLFATSLLRGAQGNALFSSVIVIDLRAKPRKARLLQDRIGAIARLTPAIARTVTLDAAALAADPEYLPELARIMAAAMAQQREPSSP